MDIRLQFLLNEYKKTGDLGIAQQIANAMVRAIEPELPMVWVVTVLRVASGYSEVHVFLSEKQAYRRAAQRCLQWLQSRDMSDEYKESGRFFRKGNYQQVVELFQEWSQYMDVDISVEEKGFEDV